MQHTITLRGEAARGSLVSWNALSALQGSLFDTSRRVLRLRADGRSHLRRPPEWLAAAASLDLDLAPARAAEKAGTTLHIQAASLRQAAPDAFAQLQLWESNLQPDDTAVSLLEESLRAAVQGNAESDRIDRGVLGAIVLFSEVLNMGFDSISLNGGTMPAVEINRSALETVERLVIKAPEPRKVIISGTLDTLMNSRRVFILKLTKGRSIRGFYPTAFSDSIAQFYGRPVVIDGEAVYRPSGEIASIVASNIRLAEASDAIWETMPTAQPRTIDDLQPRRTVAAGGSPFAKIFGAWPGDETDEEIEEVLAALG